jgi:putative flavoprotein involved in K+ transport
LYHIIIKYSKTVFNNKGCLILEGEKMSTEQIIGIAGSKESFHTVVVGGGQAGLAVGYYLAQRGENFVILDENHHTGDSWRKRWDSLKLFTPGKFDSLPGAPFPKGGDYLPTKTEVADYLEGYAKHFNLPVRHGVKVESLDRNGQGYHITAGSLNLSAQNVIVATGPFQLPYIPVFSRDLDLAIFQLHSSEYCNPGQFPARNVLVVGAGNSGAEISLELVRAGRKVWLAGRDVGRIPANGPLGKAFDGKLIWWVMGNVLNVKTPIGRKMRAGELRHGTPLGRATQQEIVEAGVKLTPRVSGVVAGKPQLEDGRTLAVDGVIWSTGFRSDYHWLHLPIFDEHGYPRHWRGVVQEAPGLYFIGLLFQTALNSSLLGGVGADAAYIARLASKNGN